MVFKNGEGNLLNILEPSTFVFFFKLHFMYLCECSEVIGGKQLSVLRRLVLLRHVYGGQRPIGEESVLSSHPVGLRDQT